MTNEGQTEGSRALLDDITKIVGTEDPVLRNLQITQRYYDLSRHLAKVLGLGNSNWSTFACWASLTAGKSIRNDEVPQLVVEIIKKEQSIGQRLSHFLARRLGGLAPGMDLFDEGVKAIREVSNEIAVGNRQVFEELAPLFVHFVEIAEEHTDNAVANEKLAAKLTDEQPLLKEAFDHYLTARQADSSAERAQWILLGNAKIGLHEQTRLQGPIQRAVDAPLEQLLFDRAAQLSKIPLIGGLIERSLRPIGARIREEWQEIATRHALNLSLPGGNEIPLGRDVPSRPQEFPADLSKLTNQKLIELLSKFDRHLDTLLGSRSNNWVQLEDRMGFIVDLFRSRQQDETLFEQPFTEAERTDISADRVPPTQAARVV